MVFQEIKAFTPSEYFLIIGCIRYDIAVERNILVVQRWLYLLLQRLEELDLGMVKSLQVTDTLRVNKYDSLFLSLVHPQDKVRIEAACLKEANTLAAFVAKQKDFLTFQCVVFVRLVIVADAPYKRSLSDIKCNWRNLHQWLVGVFINHHFLTIGIFLCQAKYRIEQMLVEA